MCRSEQPLAETIPAAHLAQDLALRPLATGFIRDRLVPGGIEGLADRFERFRAPLAERFEQLTMNQLDAAAQTSRAVRGGFLPARR